MKLITLNGYTFHVVEGMDFLGVPASYRSPTDGDFTVVCQLSKVTEDLAKVIYGKKTVTTFTPSTSYFVRPEVHDPETYDTYREALLRYLDFHFKLEPERTVVMTPVVVDIAQAVQRVCDAISRKRFPLDNEKATQEGIFDALVEAKELFDRERYLDSKNIIDFLTRSGVGIEVKIKGTKVSIYRQLERYAQFHMIEALILVSNVSMALPKEINGKPLYYIKLSNAYL